MERRTAQDDERERLLALEEDHFNDVKSARIKPASLQEAFISFANSDGGDLYIGIEDRAEPGERVRGFSTVEEANGHIHTLLEETSPAVENVEVEFLDFGSFGFVLHVAIPKSTRVHYTTSGRCYIRINARKKEIKGERITQLGYAKGHLVYEKQPLDSTEIGDLAASPHLRDYMRRVGTTLAPDAFLRKQRLLTRLEGNLVPNVAGILLFDEEPQAAMATRCAVKVYRLRTTEEEYKREQLEGMPITIGGPIEQQILAAIETVDRYLSGATYRDAGKLVRLNYPATAIKEVLVNAVIHRDYSLNDDIHIRIFDNRIEVFSPGRLPGYITVANIYDERYSRNPNLVRMLHNLPDPLNHDIGEGLDTARNELRVAGLVPPTIEEKENGVQVTIRHQRLASLEDVILEYLEEEPSRTIANRDVREISGEDDVNKVKKAFQRLRADGTIVPVNPDASAFDFRYQLAKGTDEKT